MKRNEWIKFFGLYILGLLMVASSALAECPQLVINGTDTYNACSSNDGVCHYITPYYPVISSAYATFAWQGNGGADGTCGVNADYAGCTVLPGGVTNNSYLHWVQNKNNLVISHGCAGPPPTPTATPTPPPPTPTPTPPGPTPTPTPPVTPTPTPTPTIVVCVPDTECRGRCGLVSDGCEGTIDCGNCPLPTPHPDCTTCEFPARYMAETGGFFLERLYFPEGGVIRTFVAEGTQSRIYELVYWQGDPIGSPDRKNTLIHRWNGPGIVTIPVPPAGFPIPPNSYIEIYGGKSRVTVYVQNPNTKVEVQHFSRLWEFSIVRFK